MTNIQKHIFLKHKVHKLTMTETELTVLFDNIQFVGIIT